MKVFARWVFHCPSIVRNSCRRFLCSSHHKVLISLSLRQTSIVILPFLTLAGSTTAPPGINCTLLHIFTTVHTHCLCRAIPHSNVSINLAQRSLLLRLICTQLHLFNQVFHNPKQNLVIAAAVSRLKQDLPHSRAGRARGPSIALKGPFSNSKQ